MTVDLGDLTGLATALGLLDGTGTPRPGWFADPQRFLKRALSDPDQRAALLGAVDDLLGGSSATTDSAGRTWLPLFGNGPVAVSGVVAEHDGGAAVHVGLGVRVHHLAESGVGVGAEVHVPLLAASGSTAVENPLLLGTSGADVQARLSVDLPPGTSAGDVALAGVDLTARVPTAGGVPAAGLVLRGLRMPGSPAPADLAVDAASLDALDDALLELVLGLVRAQAAGLADAEPARALAGLLGLVGGDGVPDLPVDDLLAAGPRALAGWWAQCVQEARNAWLGHLATLLSGTLADGEVAVPIGGATVTAGVTAIPGAAGLPRVVPHLRVAVGGGPGTTLRLDVEPVAVDLATGTATAVPALQVAARVAGPDGAPLLGPVDGPAGLEVTVGAIEAGFALDAGRRPVLVLRARDAVVGATPYPTLDLTDGDALAGAAGDAVGAAARSLLTPLGSLADAVAALLGLADPPAVDPVLLLRDPVAAVRDRWAALLAAGGDAVRDVLQAWQSVTAAEALRAVPVTGDGTPADPYRVRLTDGVDLLLTAEGTVASLAVAGHVAAPFALGAAMTADVRVGLLRADLAAGSPSAELGSALLAVLALTTDGDAPVRLVAGGYGITARSLGARIAWTPADGARVDPWLEAPRLVVAGAERPLDGLGVGGPDGLALPPVPLPDPAGWAADRWAALEAVAGAALAAARARATGRLAALLAAADELTGWRPRPTPPDDPAPRPRLSLAALAADPAAELERWVRSLLGLDGGSPDVPALVAALLARLLGAEEALGAGVPAQPWRIPITDGLDVPGLLLALGLPTPERLASRAATALVDWRPGDAALGADVLAAALAADAAVDDVLAAAAAGRAAVDAGLDALVERWAGTDGVVALAAGALPAGIVAHRPAGLLHTARLDSAAVSGALAAVWDGLGGPPQRLVLVGVSAEGEPDLLPPPAAGDVDLTLAGAPPEAFPVPAPMPRGTAVVRLPAKAATGGFAGQVARLRRALSGLATPPAPVVVLAGGAAGRVAVAAADGVPGIEAVVTVATPWTPLTLADVDTAPAADALRLLRTLLDLVDGEGVPDSTDLALARGLVESLLARDGRGDPLHELSAPDLPVPAGLPVHAVVGALDADAVRRALTAVVARALSVRALERTAAAAAEAAVAALGVRIPRRVGTIAGGVRAEARVDADLAGAAAGPALRVALRLSGDGRWLVGGPDPARVPGPRPLALRAVELDLVLAPAPSGRLVLHDATAFGVSRARWLVDLADGGPLLPEVRALLGEVAAQLRSAAEGTATTAADTAIAGLVDALTAVGLLDVAGGFDATTLAGLLADPRSVLESALADATRTATLAAGLRAAVEDSRAAAGSSVRLQVGEVAVEGDLATRTLTVRASSDLLALDLAADPDGVEVAARLGAGGLAAAGPPAAALELAAALPDGSGPVLHVTGVLRDPRGTRRLALWPAPAPADLLGLVPDAAAATVLQAVLTALRSALAALPPGGGDGDRPPAATTPAALLDTLLAASGLLRDPDAVAWPSGLVSDAAAWLRATAGEVRDAVPPLVEAVAGLLPAAVPHPPGSLALAPGVVLRTATAPNRLQVGLDVDGAAFAGTAAGLVVRATAGVSVTASGARPDVRVDLAADGVGAARLTVDGETVRVALVPAARPEIVLIPAGRGLPGLADAAAAGAVAALPALLTRLAAEDPAGDPTAAVQVGGRIVARTGTALGLAAGAPAVFDPAALAAFAADPADAFAARSAGLLADGLARLAEAVQPVLGAAATRSVAVADGRLAVTVGPPARRVVLGWRPGTGAVDVAVALTEVPGIAMLSARLGVGAGGVETVDVAVGPAPLLLGPVTLAPSARVVAGSALAAPTVDVGLGAGTGERLVARFGPAGPQVLAVTGTTESDVALDVARAVVGVVLDLAGGLVLGVPAVQAALARPVLGGASTADLLDGALLATGRLDAALAGSLSDAGALLRRLAVLAGNVATAMPAPVTVGDVLDVRVTRGDDGLLGIAVAVTGDEWVLNPGSDLQVGLVTDAAWIDPEVPAGLAVDVLRLTDTAVEPAPGVVVGGLGVRVSRQSGPLLDAAVTLDAASVLGFGLVRVTGGGPAQLGGGARVELEGIALPLTGASGGDNAVARGLMPSGGNADGDDAPAPRFSPALAVQQHPGGEPAVSLRAGPGDGPWFLAVQREFGPVYLEQVGLAVGQDGRRLRTIGVLVDGKVSLFGLSAAVDDLSLTYDVEGGSSPFDPAAWSVDVAGFAVTAETAGLTLAGGLRKFTPAEGGVEYLGMLLARLGVYGLTVYGGFGQVGAPGDRYSSLFLFGAVNGPIGGPPAFFVTGIGGGFGANRGLVVPADLSRFGDYPLVKALDPAARAGDPFTELAEARRHFPAARGQFWFAAGMSFTSFALVDGVVVVAVSFGNGVELNLLGLARMALPRPEAALVSIELALVARVSTREGVVLVQAQLTDNSWLLAPAVRLTGGFAFASWFAGPNRGQVVLTLGGYHPDFRREGYPVVPRLGLAWSIGSAVTLHGGAYFALTSEALMAGLKVEVHAQLGPAWAHLVFGADGIVFFDPFWLKVTVYASIDAGVTIDLWLGEVTISVHLAARLTVTGPPFHARATFEIGPVDVTFEIGPSTREPVPLTWAQFVPKYLEEAAPGLARVLTAVTGAGTVPPAGSAATGGEKSPDGQPDRPFRVVAEFSATVTSTVPLRELSVAGATTTLGTSHLVAVAPMGPGGTAAPRVTLSVRRRLASGTPDPAAPDRIAGLDVTPKRDGAFPIGAWGPAQDLARPTVPSGNVLTAADRVELVAVADIPGAGPGETPPPAIPYRQVETGRRRVLPLLPRTRQPDIEQLETAAASLKSVLDEVREEVGTGLDETAVATRLLGERGERDALAVSAWRASLAAPVLLGSLGEGLGGPAPAVDVAPAAAQPPVQQEVRPPRVLGVLSSGEPRPARDGTSRARSGTSVSGQLLRDLVEQPATVRRVTPPSTDRVAAGVAAAVPARVATAEPRARVTGRTAVATAVVPVTSAGLPGAAGLAARTATPTTRKRLAERTGGLLRGGTPIADGDVLVLELPDADTDTDEQRRPGLACREGRVRVTLLGPAGRVLDDAVVTAGQRVPVPVGTRSAVVVGGPPPDAAGSPWAVGGGWTADRPLPSATDGLLVAAGCVVDVLGRVPERGPDPVRAAWVRPAELLGDERGVATTVTPPRELVVAAVAVAVTGAGTEGLAIGVDGARQTGPLTVTADPSGASVVVVGLAGAEPGRPVTVTVAGTGGRAVLGFAAAVGRAFSFSTRRQVPAAEWLGAAAADGGLGALLPPPTAPGPARSTLAWEAP